MLNKNTDETIDGCKRLELLAPCYQTRPTRTKAAQKIFFDEDIFEYLCKLCGWENTSVISCYKLYVDSKNYAYLKARKCKTRIYLHHLIIGRPAKGFRVDHWNGHTLDNRRLNLRHVTVAQNAWNRVPNKGHRLIGVTQQPNGRWRARVMRNGVHISLGCFSTDEQAVDAYDSFTREHDGVYGRGNVPQMDAATGYPPPAARVLSFTQQDAAGDMRRRLKLAA